jgi:GT2 family glycosyltransferase
VTVRTPESDAGQSLTMGTRLTTASLTVNWGSPKDTVAALHSLASMSTRPDYIICVDNGSSAEHVSELRSGMPKDTVLIELAENTGVAAANNVGMEYAVAHGADWTLFLNNDATADPDCLSRCLDEAMAVERTGIVGPAVVFADRPDLLWFAGGYVSDWFAFPRHRGLRQLAATPPPTADTGYVSTCCALVSSAAWESVGPFRADYFMYYDDTEWCIRLRASGWRCRYLGEVLSDHAVSASSGRRGSLGISENMAYYLARNPLRFALETKGVVRRFTRVVGLLTVYGGFNAWRILRAGKRAIALAYVQGLIDGARGHMGIRSAR